MTEQAQKAFEEWWADNYTEYHAAGDFAEAAFQAGIRFAVDEAWKAVTRIWGAV